jgi:peptidoglycan/LPS O-acetylase OafA/YrhL
MNTQRLLTATLIGTVAQIVMVVAGHFDSGIKAAFMVGGLSLSFIAGAIYAARARLSWGSAIAGGVVAGGVSALLGIAVSYLLGDVPASLLALGTAGSMATGLIGGIAGRALSSGGEATHG